MNRVCRKDPRIASSRSSSGIATELFGLRRLEPWYTLRLCAAHPTVVMHGGLFTLTGIDDLSAADEADPHAPPNPLVLGAIRRAWDRGARLVSFCTGAFTLAAAGVLDGQRA
jgi:AraC family transcriptional activator FtrA